MMEIPLEKKAGRLFGPPGKLKLIYFIDDLNMPALDKYNADCDFADAPGARVRTLVGHVEDPAQRYRQHAVYGMYEPDCGVFHCRQTLAAVVLDPRCAFPRAERVEHCVLHFHE